MTLFGTDGIRGKAWSPPLDESTILRVGAAIVRARPGGGDRMRVLVGRDTRESGAAMARLLARGLGSGGAEVVSAGVLPTPGIAYLTRAEGFDAGIVISASHNPYEDNGIKVFGPEGVKIPEAYEAEIERMVADAAWQPDVTTAGPLLDDARLTPHYARHLREILAEAGPLAGSRLVLDCAQGATFAIAPGLFVGIGFDVDAIGVEPDGRNINLDCGSTHLGQLQARVTATGARLGVAFDGDGDRALFVDHTGAPVDGDAVLLIAADHLRREGRLAGNTVVATVMSNIGLEIALGERDLTLVRCPVGDKYVMEEMQRRGAILGGEQSGHVIFADHLMTGDGMATALQVLRIMAATGRELSDLASALVTYPQVLVNVRVRQKTDLLAVAPIASVVKRVEAALDGQGRLLIRYSGTEPLLRIMIEGRHDGEIRTWAEEIAGAVRTHLG
jgi:phosphoglucosamine mutase